MNENLKQYYEYLKSVNADVPEDYESFATTLSDEAQAKTYFDYLKSNNFDAPDTYESFSETLGLQKKKDISFLDAITTASGKEEIGFLGKSGQKLDYSGEPSTAQPPSPSKKTGSYAGDFLERVGAGALDIITSVPKKLSFAKRIMDIPRDIVKKELEFIGVDPDKADAISSAVPFIKPQAIEMGVSLSKDVWDEVKDTEGFKDIEKKAESMRESSARYDQTMLDYFKQGDIKKGIGVAFLGAAESLPLTLTAAFGGPVGLGEIGLYSASTQYDELDARTDMNEFSKVSNALINGSMEILTERLGSANYGALIKKLYKTAGKEQAEQAVKSGLKTWLTNIWKKGGIYTAPVGEGLEEGVNQLASNITAKVTGEDSNRPWDYNVVNAMGSGAAGGTIFTAVGLPAQLRQKQYEEEQKAKEKGEPIPQESLKQETGGIEDARGKETEDTGFVEEVVSEQEQGGETVNGLGYSGQAGVETQPQEVTTTKDIDIFGEKTTAIQNEIDTIEDRLISFYQEKFGLTEEDAERKYLTEEVDKSFPDADKINSLIDERNQIYDNTVTAFTTSLDNAVKEQGLSQEVADAIKSNINISKKTGKDLLEGSPLAERLADDKLKTIAQVIARQDLADKGLDFDGVMGESSGWSEQQKADYLKGIAEKTKVIQQKTFEGVIPQETKAIEPQPISIGEQVEATPQEKKRLKILGNGFKVPITQAGEEVGSATIEDTDEGWRIKWIDVEGTRKDKTTRGAGRDAMKLLNAEAEKAGKVLISDIKGKNSADMIRAWDKLVDEGVAEKLGEESYAFKRGEVPLETHITKLNTLLSNSNAGSVSYEIVDESAFPQITQGVSDDLIADVEENGVVPILINEDGTIRDGEHRLAILRSMGVKDIPVLRLRGNYFSDNNRNKQEEFELQYKEYTPTVNPILSKTETVAQQEVTSTTQERFAKEKELAILVDKMKAFNKKYGTSLSTDSQIKEYDDLSSQIMSLKYDLRKQITEAKILDEKERKSIIPKSIVVTAWDDLVKNKPIFNAIREAAAGVSYNKDTAIDDILNGKSNDISANDLYNAFNATREALKGEFGETILLYRAEGEQKNKATQNWASTEEGARQYGDNIIKKQIPIDNIIAFNVGLSGNYEEFIVGEKPQTRTREIGAKVIESAEVPQDVKDALLAEGIDYIPRGRKFTQTELHELVKVFGETEDGLDKLAKAVYDVKNDIKGDTRVTLNVYIAEQYSKLLDSATTPKEKEKYRNKVADAYIFGQEFATEAGQTVEAMKRWRELLSRDPESIIAIRKRQQSRRNEFALKGVEGDIKTTKDMLDAVLGSEEFKQILETEVNKAVDKIGTKKYGAEDKKRIDDFFDGLMIKTDKLFDATLGIPIAVYNGSLQVIKRAVLAGVDIANAIKQAVDYIDEWYKKNYDSGSIPSPEWNKDDYVTTMTERVKPLTKKVKKVKYKLPKKVEDTLIDKIYAKMESATKPQLRRLIRSYVTTLEDEGAISQQRFQDLFAKAIGLDVLTPEDEQKIRLTAQSLKNSVKTAEKLVGKFKELVDETDEAKIKELEKEIEVLKGEAAKAKIEAQKAARKLEGLMTERSTLGSTIHTLIQGNLLTPISLLSNVIGNTVFLPVRNVSYMVASGLDYLVSKLASVYSPLLKSDYADKHPRVRRILNSLPSPSREYNYFAGSKGWWHGFPKGLEEGIRQIWTGTLPEDEYQKFISQGLDPWKAYLRLKGQLSGKDQFKLDTAIADFLEAFPTTYMAEGFFRTLNLGDKPFRRAAEQSRLEELATLKGLTGRQREAFLNNPDPDSIEEARKAGDVAVYQQDSVISDMFKWLNQRINAVAAKKTTQRTSVVISTLGALFKATQAPYVKTPINLIAEAIDYAMPVLSLARASYYAKEGNKRKSLEYFGKAVTGYMLMNMAFWLLKEGLLSPPPDDDEKVRQAQYDAKPGYGLNIDAMWRKINPFDNERGKSDWKDGDTVWNIQRLGVASMILMGISKAYAEFSPDEMQKEMDTTDKMMRSITMIPSVVGASLDQSFLSGTASGIKAFTEGGPAFDKWLINTSKALSAVVYPNTAAQISQVFFDDNYIREVRDMYNKDEKFKKQITNTFKDRMFMGKDLPSKVTLWGERVKRVPEGESWAHVLFDVTRGVEYQKSSFGVRMYEFYERYKLIDEKEAKKILPSIPDGSNTVGWDSRNMSAQEAEELQIMVGQRRKSYVENLMNSEEWEAMDDETRIAELDKIYRTTASQIKAGMFYLDVVRKDKALYNYLLDNDLLPVPSRVVTIKRGRDKVKLTPEETAIYYEDVQRYFVDSMNKSVSDMDEKIDPEKAGRIIERTAEKWNSAKERAARDWRK